MIPKEIDLDAWRAIIRLRYGEAATIQFSGTGLTGTGPTRAQLTGFGGYHWTIAAKTPEQLFAYVMKNLVFEEGATIK